MERPSAAAVRLKVARLVRYHDWRSPRIGRYFTSSQA